MIEAQNALLQLNISSYPHMKKESQKKLYNELKRKSQINPENQMSVEDFVRLVQSGK